MEMVAGGEGDDGGLGSTGMKGFQWSLGVVKGLTGSAATGRSRRWQRRGERRSRPTTELDQSSTAMVERESGIGSSVPGSGVDKEWRKRERGLREGFI